MTDDWYARLQASGVLDTLAPYQPVLVGPYPLGMAPRRRARSRSSAGPPTCPRSRGCSSAPTTATGFALHPGSLDVQEAVFGEFTLDELPLEVAAQPDHEHRRLAAATLGIARVLEIEGQATRDRLAARIAAGEDWLEAAMQLTGLDRTALESLSTANASVARRVLGVHTPGPPLQSYVLPVLIGFTSEILIVIASAAGHSQDFTGLMLLLEAAVLGALFGTRMGLIASLAPLAVVGAVVATSLTVGSESCGEGGCSYQFASYVFIALLVGSAALVTGLIRDRYFPRA